MNLLLILKKLKLLFFLFIIIINNLFLNRILRMPFVNKDEYVFGN